MQDGSEAGEAFACKAVIFDLDGTLLDTGAAQRVRCVVALALAC
jgi:hypothetical protein